MKALENSRVLEDISKLTFAFGYFLTVVLVIFFVAYPTGPYHIINGDVTYARSADGVIAMLVMCVLILILEFVSLITRMLEKANNGES